MRDDSAMMVRTVDGRYWLNHVDDLGRARSSYLGNIGRAEVVQAWCQSHGIEFRECVAARPPRGQSDNFNAHGRT